MSQVIDANGAIHSGQDGRFAGHLQVEADASQVLPPADRFGGAFDPIEHEPVEFGRFDVGDRFYAEVATSTFESAAGEPVVKFFDRRYPMHGEPGQFIGSYFISTLREDQYPGAPVFGLNMHGGVPEWQIPAEQYADALAELARRAPSHDGRTHALNRSALELLDEQERATLSDDLAGHPFGDELTLAEAIRTHGVMSRSSELPPGTVRFGDGRTSEVSKTTMLALSKYPALMRRMAG